MERFDRIRRWKLGARDRYKGTAWWHLGMTFRRWRGFRPRFLRGEKGGGGSDEVGGGKGITREEIAEGYDLC